MNRVILYGYRLFLLAAVLQSIFHGKTDVLTAAVLVSATVVCWIAAEIIYSSASLSGNVFFLYASFSELMLALSFSVFTESLIFPVFTVLLYFSFFYELGIKKAAAVAAVSFLIFLSALIIVKNNYLRILIVPFSAAAGFLCFRAVSGEKKELQDEIDAQQAQIDGKNKLLSTLSHELRTPLAVIKTSTEILLEKRPGELNATQSRFLGSVLDNTMRMVRFVDTILASIKVEYAWFRMKKKPMDVRQVIKKVCGDLDPFIASRNQELKYTYPNLLSRTLADENWIQQVLINLIHNASKHIVAGGRIIISVTENEQCIVVSVSDDGSGIMNREKPMIFSEFYQGKEGEGENLDGAGLGLSIVKNVIEKHNGKVYVGSVAGLGTTLSFTLPKEGDPGCGIKY